MFWGNGRSGYERGNLIETELRRKGTSKTFKKRGGRYNAETNVYTRDDGVYCYTTSSVSVTPQGDLYEYNDSLYRLTSSGSYVKVGVNLYRSGGTAKTYYTRSNGATRYKTTLVTTELFESDGDETVTLQGEEFTDAVYDATGSSFIDRGTMVTLPLFQVGTEVPGGLFKNFTPEEITIQNVNALTV